MQVTLGKKGLSMTWQQDFPATTKCCRCSGMARIGFVAHEGMSKEDAELQEKTNNEGKIFVCRLHPNKGKGSYWLHDCCAVAVYFCKDCLRPTALYNQG